MAAASRSKLKRILDRLKGAILNILHTSKTQQPSIDYASLVSLSNSSRIDAIKTMDELSHRLSKPSSSSLSGKRKSSSSSSSSASSSSPSSPSSKSKTAPKNRSSKTKTKETIGGKTSKDSNQEKANKIRKVAHHSSSTPSHDPSPKGKHQKEITRPAEDDHVGDLRISTISPNLRRTTDTTRSPKRISYLSMSSGSTKLGEIPIRRSRLVWNSDEDDFEYGYRPVYPLHTSKPAPEERAGFFKRLFGAREKN